MTGSPSAGLLDARSMRCPKPVIELAKLARDIADGESVTVLSDDPAAPGDIAAWCRMRGHELTAQQAPDGPGGATTSVVRIRRRSGAVAAAATPPAGTGIPAG